MEYSELSSDESVIAFYLLKVLELNLNFATVTKEDVKFMCMLYSAQSHISSCSAEDYFANRQQGEDMIAYICWFWPCSSSSADSHHMLQVPQTGAYCSRVSGVQVLSLS